MNRTSLLVPVLALAALIFGWRAYEAWTGPLETVGTSQPNPAAVPIGLSQEEAQAPPDLSVPVASIVARPVFRPDRRPFREDAAAQAPKRNYESELSRFTLLGVLLLGKDRKGVVVSKGASGREERWEVAPGDSLPGFIVKEVGADGVTVTADNNDFLLPLYAGGPKAPPGQAPVRTDVAPSRPPAPSPQPPVAGPPGTVKPPVGTTVAPPAPSTPPAVASPPTESPVYDRSRLRPRYLPGRR